MEVSVDTTGGSGDIQRSSSRDGQQLPQNATIGGQAEARMGTGRSGPRSAIGKERSKRNALKHGIFTKAVLLDCEPKLEFDALLRGLRRDLLPDGMLEGLLVEKLATILWRQRRLLETERSAVQKNIQKAEAEKANHFDERSDFAAKIERLRAQRDTDGPHCRDR
jgi:hypothetical protein